MIYLNDFALRYAIQICAKKKNYKILIVAFTKLDVETCFFKIKKLQEYNKKIIKYVASKNTSVCFIEFINGSKITITRAANTASRGNKCHLLIADKRIKKEIIKDVFMPCEILNYDKTLFLIKEKGI